MKDEQQSARDKARQKAWENGAAVFINYSNPTAHQAWIKAFNSGYDAGWNDRGHAEALAWVAVSETDLPKVEGDYLWRKGSDVRVQYFSRTSFASPMSYWLENYDAWMPIPEELPEEKQNG